jgi:polar amino acid transport system ATP-binding protein
MAIIELRDVKKHFGDFEVFKSVNATVEKGDVICIVGGSGVGKSTLIRAINMLDKPNSGEVIFEGTDLMKLSRKELDAVRQKIGMVFQSFNLFEHLSVLENVTIGPIKLLGMSPTEAEKQALELLDAVGLKAKAHSYPDELSGGQKQRVAIARTLSMQPQIILFDEPTSALDPNMVGEVTAVIRSLALKHVTMIVVTHDMDFVKNIATKIWLLAEGGIYDSGTVEEIFEHPQKALTQEFVLQIKSFEYDVSLPNFDFIDLQNKLELFCIKQNLADEQRQKCRLIIEEVVTLLPKIEGTRILLHIPGSSSDCELHAFYKGIESDILAGDGLSAKIIRQQVDSVENNYNNYTNEVVLKW